MVRYIISTSFIVNSKNANTCNADGEEIAEKVSNLLADAVGIKPEEVIVASTLLNVPLKLFCSYVLSPFLYFFVFF